jgi:hypothetical protein
MLGLVYFFSVSGAHHILNTVSSYSKNILFRTFLYPYFERNTIKEATYSLSKLIGNYLEECSQLTRYALDELADYIEPDAKLDDLLHTPPIAILQYQLNWHMKSFLLKTAIMTEDLIDWRHYNLQLIEQHPLTGKIRCIANDRQYTFALLSGDKKFTA